MIVIDSASRPLKGFHEMRKTKYPRLQTFNSVITPDMESDMSFASSILSDDVFFQFCNRNFAIKLFIVSLLHDYARVINVV